MSNDSDYGIRHPGENVEDSDLETDLGNLELCLGLVGATDGRLMLLVLVFREFCPHLVQLMSMGPHRHRYPSEADDDDGDGHDETAGEEETDVQVVIQILCHEIKCASESVAFQDIGTYSEERWDRPEDGIAPDYDDDNHRSSMRH